MSQALHASLSRRPGSPPSKPRDKCLFDFSRDDKADAAENRDSITSTVAMIRGGARNWKSIVGSVDLDTGPLVDDLHLPGFRRGCLPAYNS